MVCRRLLALFAVTTAIGCIQADAESGDTVVYANTAEGPPTHVDAGAVDAAPEQPDALTTPDEWKVPDVDDATASRDAGDDSPREFDETEITIGPESRPARVILPTEYDDRRDYPVVFLFHSYASTGSAQDRYFGLSDRIDEYEFILVLPEGTTDAGGQQFWNATDYCCDFYGADPDDVAYFETLYGELLERTSANADQIHLMGHSNGAFLGYRLACDHGSKIATVAGLAGSGHPTASICNVPDGSVSLLHIHGTHDAVIYYNGVIGAYPSASVMTRRWSRRNACSTSRSLDDYVSLDAWIWGTETERRSHRDCPADIDVQLWTMYGSSHVPALTPAFTDEVLEFALDRTNPDAL